MKRILIIALLLLPFLAPWLLRADTATVTVGATIAASTVVVEVEENYARVTVEHAAMSDVVAHGILPDGTMVPLLAESGEWVCLLDCEPGIPLEAWAALRPLR